MVGLDSARLQDLLLDTQAALQHHPPLEGLLLPPLRPLPEVARRLKTGRPRPGEEYIEHRSRRQLLEALAGWARSEDAPEELVQDILSGGMSLLQELQEPLEEPLYCHCKSLAQQGRAMLSCDSCGEWMHPECEGIKLFDRDLVHEFICSVCSRDGHPKTKIETAQPVPVSRSKKSKAKAKKETEEAELLAILEDEALSEDFGDPYDEDSSRNNSDDGIIIRMRKHLDSTGYSIVDVSSQCELVLDVFWVDF